MSFAVLTEFTEVLRLLRLARSQINFLTNLGIHQRAEIIGKNKTFSEKSDIFYRLKRLVDK